MSAPHDQLPVHPSESSIVGKRIFVESLGCAGNRVDGERVKQLYVRAGWTSTEDPAEADVIVLQTCGFTNLQERVALRRLEELGKVKQHGAQVIVGGCLPAINPKALGNAHDGPTFGPRSLERAGISLGIVPDIQSIPALARSIESPRSVTIRVATGCLDRCTYCAIPFANGKIRSRALSDIVHEVLAASASGVDQFHLVAEDIGAWGRDLSLSLTDLLESLLSLPIDVKFQVDNLNPNWIIGDLDHLLDLLASPKILPLFYIPIQSGSDSVLRRMKRRYTALQVRNVFAAFRERFEGARYSTDFIVGFPGESEADFEQTRALLCELQPDFVSIYAYEVRPQTPASRLDDEVPEHQRVFRARVLIAEMLAIEATRRGIASVDALISVATEHRGIPINTNVRIT